MTDINSVCEFLRGHDRFAILTHASPDGDTIGAGFGLCYALKAIGKQACVLCPDGVPGRYQFFTDKIMCEPLDGQTVIAVDVADPSLLGRLKEEYGQRVDLCIDHHPSNTGYAEQTCLVADAAAACEIIYDIVRTLNVPVDGVLADCLYTGIATDTGCFKFSNCTSRTHRIAADLIEAGAESAEINRIMFDTKSRGRIEVERRVLSNIEFHFNEKCALITITEQMRSLAEDSDLDGITALPRQIEGVLIGITLRERDTDRYKISVRTHEPFDASEICRRLGGGGHARAAGCELKMKLDSAKAAVLETIKKYMGELSCKD